MLAGDRTDHRKDPDPAEPAEPVAARLSTLDRYLPVWIIAAMVLSLIHISEPTRPY